MSTTPLTTEKVRQLKVAELKEELKKRGAKDSGSKNQLIQRLAEIIERESAAPAEAPTLTEKEKDEEITDKPAAEEQSPVEKPTETKSKTTGIEEDGEIKPKHTPIVYNIPQTDATARRADEEAKKKRRAERFGKVDAAEREVKKLKARTEHLPVKFSETEVARMEQRAKRFAQASAPDNESAKDGKGVIDLSHIVTSSSVTEDEKKKRRAERFGTKKN